MDILLIKEFLNCIQINQYIQEDVIMGKSMLCGQYTS